MMNMIIEKKTGLKETFVSELFQRNKKCFGNFPDKEKAESFIINLFNFLFASYQERFQSEEAIEIYLQELKQQMQDLIFSVLKNEEKASLENALFFESLPPIYNILMEDALATFRFDPAAKSMDEVLIAYPGFFATVVYRVSHQLFGQEIPILPRLFSEYAHGKTGIDIHPAAIIGRNFTIDHGTGIVIGETAVIGNNVKLYQGVTLGAVHVDKEMAFQKRHPTIEDNVIIYSGATILGGNTVIGHDTVIGGNVWITSSVSPFSVVYHKSEVKVRGNNVFPEVIDFVI